MSYDILAVGIAFHLMMYEHLPHWGGWFNRLLAVLPSPLRTLYEQWRCPFCAGFWIGLALHGLTQRWMFPAFADLPDYWGWFALPLGWFLDALAFALMNKIGVLVVNALSYPALLGYQKKQEFFGSAGD